MAHFSFHLSFASGSPLNMSKMWADDDKAIDHAKALRREWPDATLIIVREGSRVVYDGSDDRLSHEGDRSDLLDQ